MPRPALRITILTDGPQVFGIDETQEMLASLPPKQLFPLTGMFHPESNLKASFVTVVIVVAVVVSSAYPHSLTYGRSWSAAYPLYFLGGHDNGAAF